MKQAAVDAFTIDCYRASDAAGLLALWQACGLIVPWNNPYADIERKMADSPELFFVGRSGGALVASCMAGYDGHRGWIYYLAVQPSLQRSGYAAQLVAHSEHKLRELGCPKIDLMVRNSNQAVIGFYQSIGYQQDPVVVLSKRLQADEAHDLA
jgi:ribosomal protein S18 acetylase RimI-like enzyme